MNVLVIGGTRGTGRAVVAAAFAAGHTLTVMARNAAGFARSVTGVRLVVGDAADADDVDRAIAGQDAVVWTVGARRLRRDVPLFSRGTAHVLAAMRRHGVRRLICVTGHATGGRGPLGTPLFAAAVAVDKSRQEALVRDADVEWTIVRPAALRDGKATGLFQALTVAPEGRAKRIARADVAEFIVENLDAPDFVRSTVVLTG
ncbi:MAG: NAD(P)H-binding protein [Burkholderiales bacterium]